MSFMKAALLKDFFKGFINLIFPLYCQICRRPLDFGNNRFLCQACWNTIPRIPRQRHFDFQFQEYYFDRAWAVCQYEGIIKECIHLFKYRKKLFLDNLFLELMVDFAGANMPLKDFDLVVAVPLHYVKLKERGFNQAQVLANSFARHFKIPISKNNLLRIRPTLSQTVLDKQKRLLNVKGAFASKRKDEFKEKHMLLMDDVFTTGTTLNECSKALKNAGAKNVSVFTIARGN